MSSKQENIDENEEISSLTILKTILDTKDNINYIPKISSMSFIKEDVKNACIDLSKKCICPLIDDTKAKIIYKSKAPILTIGISMEGNISISMLKVSQTLNPKENEDYITQLNNIVNLVKNSITNLLANNIISI